MNATEITLLADTIVSPILASLGAALSLSLSCFGAAYATGKIGSWLSNNTDSEDIQSPSNNIFRRYFVGIVISGVLAIYGLIISVIILSSFSDRKVLPLTSAARMFAGGLTVGVSSLAAGYGIGYSVPSGKNPKDMNFVHTLLIWIFSESLGLYGLIVGMICIQ